MDREIAPEYVKQTRNRRWLIIGGAVIGLAVLFYFFKKSLSSTLESARIRTGTVAVGDVENTLMAAGEIIPAYEQIFTSPIRASIKRILLTPGTRVRPGQPIVELDKSLTEIEFERYKDQLELKKNSIDQLRMKLNKDLYDAEINDRIKSLNINKLKADFEDAKRLQKVGGGTVEDVTRAENALKIAELEKKQLENDLKYNREFGRLEAEGGVRLTQDGDRFTGKRLRYDTTDATGVLEEPSFLMRRAQTARGSAERVEFLGKDRYRLSRAFFTTCEPGNDDWRLEARELELDYEEEDAVARGARLRFLGTTILGSPYLSLPLNNRRRSGLLAPQYAQTSNRGAEFVVPFGIKSVLGFGGVLPPGDLFAVIMFSRVPVPRETADLFRNLALSVKLAILPFSRGPVFD